MAIFGLVVLMWGATFPAQLEGEYHVKEVELRAALPALEKANKTITAEYRLLEQQQNELDEAPAGKTPSAKWKELQARKVKLHAEMLEADKGFAVAQAKFTVLESEKVKYGVLGKWAIGGGLLLTLLGFGLWYIRVQRHLDIQMVKADLK